MAFRTTEKMLSKCCNEPVKIVGDEFEGTQYYLCTWCLLATDLALKEEEKDE